MSSNFKNLEWRPGRDSNLYTAILCRFCVWLSPVISMTYPKKGGTGQTRKGGHGQKKWQIVGIASGKNEGAIGLLEKALKSVSLWVLVWQLVMCGVGLWAFVAVYPFTGAGCEGNVLSGNIVTLGEVRLQTGERYRASLRWDGSAWVAVSALPF